MRYETERGVFDIRDHGGCFQVIQMPDRGGKIGTGKYVADFTTLTEAQQFCDAYAPEATVDVRNLLDPERP